MLRRLTLMLLITILPIQSWAVVDMRLQKEALQLSTSSVPSQDTHHLCHQDVAANAVITPIAMPAVCVWRLVPS